MKIQLFLFLRQIQSPITQLVSIGLLLFNVSPSFAEVPNEKGISRQSELYNTLPGENQKDSILDATNPMELINRLRRATAMDNATPPSEAIDQAIKALEIF